MPNLQVANNLSATEQYIGDGTSNSNLAIGTDGKVGIGTTDPGYKLDVAGDIALGDTLYVDASGHHYIGKRRSGTNDNYATYLMSNANRNDDSDGGANIAVVAGQGGASIDGYVEINAFGSGSGAGANTIRLRTRDGSNSVAERMRIASDGNVGIGTTSPAGRLHVDGGTAAAGVDGQDIIIKAQDGGSGTTEGGDIILMPGLESPSGYISKVGIGTTSPTAELHIFCAHGANIQIESDNHSGCELSWRSNGSPSATVFHETYDPTAGTAGTMTFWGVADDTKKVTIDSDSGNVGIGTTSPDTKLHVNGVITLGGAGGPQIHSGSGSPEGSVTAPTGSLYMNTSGGSGTTLYVKESGSGNTGWVGK